jgi:hypothetical protein
MAPRSPLIVTLLCCGLACTGKIGQDPGGPGTGGSGDMPKPDAEGNLPYAAPQPAAAALPARTWRLTHVEYRKSVRDLTGVDVDTTNFEPETDGGLFSNISNVNFVRLSLAGSYYDAAAMVADTISDAQLRALAAPCGNLTATCKADFIRNTLTRAYRRPPAADEIAEAGELYDLSVPSGDAVLPFRSVVQGTLTAPFFLYRTEIGSNAAQASFQLTNHEVASLLSYSLIGQPPPASLIAAADRGELTTPASLRTNVEALLGTPEAAEPLRAFLFQWLTLTKFNDQLFKFPDLFPGFDGVRTAMIDEANAFFTAHGAMNGTIATLLTGSMPAPAGALGTFYSSPGAGVGTRTGWLGLGAFLSVAAHANLSSPTLRGHFVRERILCQHMTIPPGVPVLEEIEQMGATPKSTRDLYDLHQTKAECASCHQALDWVGFTFEDFDGAGRFRTAELFRNQTAATPINTQGRLVNTDVNRPLANHTELAQALASSAWVRECAAIQAFRYAFGYGDEVPRGLPPVMAGYQALTGGGTWRDLLAAVTSSASTYERTRN